MLITCLSTHLFPGFFVLLAVLTEQFIFEILLLHALLRDSGHFMTISNITPVQVGNNSGNPHQVGHLQTLRVDAAAADADFLDCHQCESFGTSHYGERYTEAPY